MNTIEEISEISEVQGEKVNGNTKSTIKTKISSSSTTSTSSSHNTSSNGHNGSATPHTSPQSPTGGVVNGAAKTAAATSNGVNAAAAEDYLEDLKIIGHLKNIEKLNEKRRVFLSNTISTEYSSDEKTETSTTTKKAAENGDDTASSNYNAKRVLVREHHIDNSSDVEQPRSRPSNTITVSQKYATLPLKTPRTPNTPPPKPPMLSRTRSIGVGDSHSMSSPPPTPKFPAPLATATQEYSSLQPNEGIIVTTTMQPAESTIVTTTKVAEPIKVTCIQLDPEETATVVLRSNAAADVNGEIVAGFAPEASSKDIPAKHYERLIEELKCPGCALPMKSPIYLCKTGHSICEQCTRILLLCPLCKVSEHYIL